MDNLPYDPTEYPYTALHEVGKVMAEGKEKYGHNNWHKISCSSNLDHCMLHLNNFMREQDGTNVDEELFHTAARALMALDQYCRKGWEK